MVLSVRRCAEFITQLHRLKVKVTLQGHVIYPPIPVRPISPESFERFSLNFTQIFLSVRRFAEHINKLPRLKVKVTGQSKWIYPWSSCPFHISWTLWAIFIKLQPNIHLSAMMCRPYDSVTQTQGQGHASKSWDLPFNSCPFHISWTLWAIFIKLQPNIHLSAMMCRPYDSVTQTQGQGHTSKSWDLPFNSCPLHISWTLWTILLHLNVPLSEVVCRANDSDTQTQGQTSRSWN